MKKSVVLIIIVVVVVAGGTALLVSHKADAPNPKSDMTQMDMSQTDKTSGGGSDDSAAEHQANSTSPTSNASSVTIQDFAFSPASITVKKGTTVTWTNKDSTTHTVTETDSQTGPNSGDLATGKSYSFTFNTVGTFKYHCSIHPDMVGTVTVTE